MDLCNEYHRNFNCYPDGRLRVIGLSGQEFDHLNLLMIPNTVTMLYLKKTKLKTISKWADLRGKSLKFLALGQNPDLQLDLGGLKGELDHLSLEHLIVSSSQRAYFGMPKKSPDQSWIKMNAQLRVVWERSDRDPLDFLGPTDPEFRIGGNSLR